MSQIIEESVRNSLATWFEGKFSGDSVKFSSVENSSIDPLFVIWLKLR